MPGDYTQPTNPPSNHNPPHALYPKSRFADERANEFAPQHSRIFREMILVASPSKPAVWDAPNTLTFILAVVEHTLRRSVSDDADIFRSGGDSLQATWICNTILRASRDSDPGAVKRLPMNLVFKAPTISTLTNIVHAVMNDVHAVANVSDTPHDLWKYVEEYSANFPFRPTDLVDRPPPAKEVVLITGTTGGFGCDSIERVYALNRKGSDALARQHASWTRNSGWSKPWSGFDITPQLLEEIRGLLTHIKVDFILSLPLFQVDLQGPRKLVDLAISSPFTQAPTILFLSCKWVTKHVLQNAAEERGICSIVMRLGQVAGDKTGHWTRKSGCPRSSSLRCDKLQNVAWVPGYEYAKAFTELRYSPEPFVHLVHPRPVSWRAVIAPVGAELGVPLVSHSEWLSALQESVEAAGHTRSS
ncbi:hypothetical protein BD413DRAFT_675121 [Trametes elegans]|nr:hypothetical protein BD413DRAFT_675121 [Trametes elegans]